MHTHHIEQTDPLHVRSNDHFGISNSQFVIASVLSWHRPPRQVCEAISSLKHEIASTEERRLANDMIHNENCCVGAIVFDF